MSKIASYLNDHLTGEVVSDNLVLDAMQTDGSVLLRRPEMVVQPAHTSDVRKIMRFCSQLAEKGHVMPVTARGFGTDTTGAATTHGMIIDMRQHFDQVLGIDPKQKMIHVQAGMSRAAVRAVLSTHRGQGVPDVSYWAEDGTIGGAVSTGAVGLDAAVRGSVGDAIHQLEVVLSDGSLMQTGRLSKRDFSQKKALPTFEGAIYRQVETILKEHRDTIKQLQRQEAQTEGYSGITRVRGSDGSVDLTPLFVGAQGSLGIISEAIVRTDFIPPEVTVVTAAYQHLDEAQEAADIAMAAKASIVQLIDGRLFNRASRLGKKLGWAPPGCFHGAVMLAAFDTFSDRARAKATKKLFGRIEETSVVQAMVHDIEYHELHMFFAPVRLAMHPAVDGTVVPQFLQGIRMHLGQVDRFMTELRKLERLHTIELPVTIDARCGFIDVHPAFVLSKISERQAMLKVSVDLAALIARLGGSFAGHGGDGRLKAGLIRPHYDPRLQKLYDDIKQAFDPLGLFGAGVKQEVAGKQLASELNAWCRRLQ